MLDVNDYQLNRRLKRPYKNNGNYNVQLQVNSSESLLETGRLIVP
jgi:hypothetical protein